MARLKKPNNSFRECIYEGERCVVFTTEGKYKYEVIVDENDWYSFLCNYSWTAIRSKNRVDIKTSIHKQSQKIWRIIIENHYSELDCWGVTVDHINNNPLDNRVSNLRLYHSSILNSTNIASKYQSSDMQYIHQQGTADHPNGYKVHYNLAGKTFYTNFSVKQYGSLERALDAAKQYRDDVVLRQREEIIHAMIKKTRDIEFERGLRDKINAGEQKEIERLLVQYGIFRSE